MKILKIIPEAWINFSMTRKEWNKFKKAVENELDHDDYHYSEIRFCIDKNTIEVEAHCLEEESR